MSVELNLTRRSCGRRPDPEQPLNLSRTPKKQHRLLAGLAAVSLGLASIGSASAQVWGINIDVHYASPDFNGQGVFGGPAEVWNHVPGNTTTANLLDNSGGVTPVSISINKGNGWNDNNAFNTLLDDWIKTDDGSSMDIVLSGLDTSHTYNVVSYSVGNDHNQGASYQGGDLVGECTGNAPGTDGGTTRTNYILGVNYLVLSNFVASAGTFTMHLYTNNSGYGDWNGMQIQRSDVTYKKVELTTQPTNMVIRAGRTATLSVGVDSGGLLYYSQWYFNGNPIANATSASLTFSNANASMAGAYFVTITNSQGSVTSSIATISVDTTTATGYFVGGDQGEGLDLHASSFVLAEYYGADAGPLVLQDATFTCNNARVMQAADYANNGPIHSAATFGTSSSDENLNTIANNWAEAGSDDNTLDFVISTANGQNYKLQLILHDGYEVTRPMTIKINGQVIEPSLDPNALGIAGSAPKGVVIGYYFTGTGQNLPITIVGNVGLNGPAMLNALTLEALPATPQAPYLVLNPQSQTAMAGTTVTFGAMAGGSLPPFAYQWSFEGTPIPGATNSTCKVVAVQDANAGEYSVTASNSVSGASASATLTVNSTIGVFEVTGPFRGQGLDLEGVFDLAEYYGNASGAPLLIGGVNFLPSARPAGNETGGNTPNFGTSADAINFATLSSRDMWLGGAYDIMIPTTNGIQYKLQLIFHDNDSNKGVGARTLTIAANGTPLVTAMDCIAQGASVANPKDLAVVYYFTGDGNAMDINITSSSEPIISALTLENLSAAPAVPVLLAPLANQVVLDGATAQFTVHASGVGLSYKWQKQDETGYHDLTDGGNISGSATPTLIVSNAGAADITRYGVTVWNTAGSTNVTAALGVIVNQPHAIVGQWLSGATNLTDTSGFTSPGTHDGALVGTPANAVWSTDVPFTGTGYSLDMTAGNVGVSIANTANSDAGYVPTFDGIISNGFSVTLWAKGWPTDWNPVVSKHGEDNVGFQVRNNGQWNVPTFTIRGTPGDDDPQGTIARQDVGWHHYAATWDGTTGVRSFYVDNKLAISLTGDFGPMAVADTYSLVLGGRNNGVNNNGNYSSVKLYDVRIYGYALSTDEILSINNLTNPAPSIASAPSSQSALVGQTVSLDASAVEGSGLSFQWQKLVGGNYVALTEGGNISGSTGAILTLSNLALTDSGTYRLHVENVTGSLDLPVTVTVYADLHKLLGKWVSGPQSYADQSGFALAGTHDGVLVGDGASTAVWSSDIPANFPSGDMSLDLSAGDAALSISNSCNRDPNYVEDYDSAIAKTGTVMIWAKGWPGNWSPFFSKRGESGLGWQVRRFNDTAFPDFTVGNDNLNSPIAIDTTTPAWHHYAATWDATGLHRLYVDNVLVATQTYSYTSLPLAENDYLVIGGKYQGGYGSWSRAMVYDARIYGYALSASELTAINKLPQSVPTVPTMTVSAVVNGQFTITWDEGTLQSTTALNGANTVWVNEPAGTSLTVDLTQTTGNKFYRVTNP